MSDEYALINNRERFTGRAQAYAARPEYDENLISTVISDLNISKFSKVLEIGSGTGNLSSVLLAEGLKVFAVEPNEDMRNIAAKKFADNLDFVSISGSATRLFNLDSGLVDFKAIFVGQALHWWAVDAQIALDEWRKLAASNAYFVGVCYYLNDSSFARDLDEALSKNCPDYDNQPVKLMKRNSPGFSDELYRFYIKSPTQRLVTSSNTITLSMGSLWDLLSSMSFCPPPTSRGFGELIKKISPTLLQYVREDGEILASYTTEVWYGHLA